jgi:hypothetical protein
MTIIEKKHNLHLSEKIHQKHNEEKLFVRMRENFNKIGQEITSV